MPPYGPPAGSTAFAGVIVRSTRPAYANDSRKYVLISSFVVAGCGPPLPQPSGGFHVVEFLPGQGPSRIVLDVTEVEAAAGRIRSLYGTP